MRQSRKIVPPSASELLYADSSALVKLVLDEPERPHLESYLKNRPLLASSALAVVEVSRAVKLAHPGALGRTRAEEILGGCLMIEVDDGILARAVELATRELRALDAIHLASAEYIEPAALVAYDRRLLEAAARAGFATASPGA